MRNYVSKWDLYFFSLKLGFNYLINCYRGKNLEGIKRLIIPLDLDRCFEIPQTVSELNIVNSDRVFDLSSPKLASLFISHKYQTSIMAVDIFTKEIISWRSLLKTIDPLRTKFANLSLEIADGRKLKINNSSYSKIYSISVIEHIPGNGDTKTIKELARILKPKGLLALTVPFSQKAKLVYSQKDEYSRKKNDHKRIFAYRIYNYQQISQRLIIPSGLQVKKIVYCEEKYSVFTRLYNYLFPFSVAIGLLIPFLSEIFLKQKTKGNFDQGIILLVLEKPAK